MTQGLPIGSYLRNGAFRIERVLGQGGFGITYLATDTTLDRIVAIKEFFPKTFCYRTTDTSQVTLGTENNREFVVRLKDKFLKEARNIAKFNHPNIIRIFAAFEENDTAYYVMEYIDGCSLEDMVKMQGPMSPSAAVAYISHVGSALEYVHALQINHLDVKPANIMVRQPDYTPILIDFGLSKQYDSFGNQTSTTVTGISQGFAPMEQYVDGGVKEFSPQTDIYALSASLYYLLTGVIPSPAPSLAEEGLYLPNGFPQPLIAPIQKGMAPFRNMRQQSVGEFVYDINQALQGMSGNETHVVFTPPTHTTSSQHISQPPVPPQHISQPPVPPQHISQPPVPPQHISQPPMPPVEDDKEPGKKKSTLKYAFIVLAALAVVALVFVFLGSSDNDKVKIGADTGVEANVPEEVANMDFVNSKGVEFKYSGPVNSRNEPDGTGTGIYQEGVYTGEYIDGLREGSATYETHDRSNKFEGQYTFDSYDNGRLTFSDGSYYEGTFKDNNFLNGIWYKPDGTVEYNVADGKVIAP